MTPLNVSFNTILMTSLQQTLKLLPQKRANREININPNTTLYIPNHYKSTCTRQCIANLINNIGLGAVLNVVKVNTKATKDAKKLRDIEQAEKMRSLVNSSKTKKEETTKKVSILLL